MNQVIRFLLFFLFITVTFYYAWSEGDRNIREEEYSKLSATTPPLLIRSMGYDRNFGNGIAMQTFMNVLDYSSQDRFFKKLDFYMAEAQKKGFFKAGSVVLFPEHIGTPLVLLGEKKDVYGASSVASAFSQIAISNIIGYLRYSTSLEGNGEIIFKMKSEEMRKAYLETFQKLSSQYKVTIIAGSILLPEPEIDKKSGELKIKDGKIFNSSFIFLPDGSIHPEFAIKKNLAKTEQTITSSLLPENAGLHYKNFSVLLSNDTLYNSIYTEKIKNREIILSPSILLEKDEIDWKNLDIYGTKEILDTSLTQAELWRKYSIYEKMKFSQSNRVIMQVFMLGKFFDISLEGESSALIRYVASEGLDNKSPAILNVWF